MNTSIRKAQKELLAAFAKNPGGFALAGGTALEIFYLQHRFSVDLDFFSPAYNLSEMEIILTAFGTYARKKPKLEAEMTLAGRAKMRFYSLAVPDLSRPLKIDFIEDVLFKEPFIKNFGAVPVYSAENIYWQKIVAVTGSRLKEDAIGRQELEGRQEARDIFDIYMLSKKIIPLHLFLQKLPAQLQRGMARWYQTFSRQDLKLALLDLDIYDKKFDARGMIAYLEDQIKKFVGGVMEK